MTTATLTARTEPRTRGPPAADLRSFKQTPWALPEPERPRWGGALRTGPGVVLRLTN